MSREEWWDITLLLIHYICPIFNLFGFTLAFKKGLWFRFEPDLFYMSTPVMKKSPPLSQKMRSKSSSCKFILLGERRRQKRCTSGTEQRVCNSIRVLIPFRQIWPFVETGIPDEVYAVNTCFVSLDPNKYEQLNHQHPRPLQLRALSTAFRDLWPVLTSEIQCLRTVWF